MTQQDIFAFQYLMEDLTVLPHLLFLHLFVISSGHAFGASVFHILRMSTGLKGLFLELHSYSGSEVNLDMPICLNI